MSIPNAPMPRRRWWQRRWVWGIAAIVALLALAPFTIPFYQDWQLDQELDAVLAETDRLDPGWRHEAINQKRAQVPDEENAYFLIQKFQTMLPKGYDPKYTDLPLPEGIMPGSSEHFSWCLEIQSSLDDTPPECMLNQLQSKALASEWKENRQAIELASRLRTFHRCAIPKHSGFERSNDMQACRTSAALLSYAIMFDIQELRYAEALDRAEALISFKDLLHDDSDLMTAYVDCAISNIACEAMKRILCQGVPDADRLKVIQARIEKQLARPQLLEHLRKHRAYEWRASEELLKSSREEQEEVMKMVSSTRRMAKGNEVLADTLPWYLAWFKRENLEDPRRWARDRQHDANRWVEFAKLSDDEQRQKLDELIQTSTVEIRSLVAEIHEMHWRSRMELTTTQTAIALERYHQAKGTWPKTLGDLVPAFLASVPNDVFTSEPLLYRSLKDGVIVYSVGADKTDNGGKLRPDAETIGLRGLDIGVRLWDPPQRRQPALPPIVPRPRQVD